MSNGCELDFVRMTCRHMASGRVDKLELEWEKSEFVPYAPYAPNDPEDDALLSNSSSSSGTPGAPPSTTWLWWAGEWDHFGDEQARTDDPRWRAYTAPADAQALEAGYQAFLLDPSKKEVVINSHYSASF
jgi:hypothetical protein